MTLDDRDEDYNSSEDEDFTLNETDRDVTSSSESESGGDESVKAKPKKAKQTKDELKEDAGFGSGDEAVARKGKRKRNKAGENEDDEDEGGEGGFVKTRSQRATEKKVKGPLATTTGATADVNALWASMNPAATTSTSTTTTLEASEVDRGMLPPISLAGDTKKIVEKTQDASNSNVPSGCATSTSKSITIQRTYMFAGKTHTESRIVDSDSAEARAYLNSLLTKPDKNSAPAASNATADPGPTSTITTSPPFVASLKLTSGGPPRRRRAISLPKSSEPVKKMSTLEKSRLDWAGFVDKEEGLDEDLEKARKGGKGWLERQEWLDGKRS